MSLIGFHRFLIGTAIVFCLGFGIWQMSGAGGTSGVALGSVFLVLGLGLIIYLRRLARFLGYDEEGTTPP